MTRALDFDPRSRLLAVGRTSVAMAGLTVLVFTADQDLFPAASGGHPEPRCTGLAATSLWCLGSGTVWSTFARLLAIGVLLLVVVGYRPRWTCVPHWYVTVSLGLATQVANGGEQAARLITLLLIPLCLGDDRTWHWTSPRSAAGPLWRGAGYAGHLAIRTQVALIYGYAVVAKLVEPQWRNGTAMHYVLQNAYYGGPPELTDLLTTPLLRDWSVPAITWAALAAEAFIAVSALCGVAVRRWALVAGIGLHGAIMVTLGLISFGLVMIGLLCVAACAGPVATRRRRPSSPGP